MQDQDRNFYELRDGEAEPPSPNPIPTSDKPRAKRSVGRVLRRLLAALLAILAVCAAALAGSFRVGDTSLLFPEAPERGTVFSYGDVVDTSSADYTYEEMRADLYELEEAYPKLFRVSVGGSSADGREILYGDLGPVTAKRQIFVSAGIHGREYLTPLLAMKMTEYYLLNYYTEDENGVAFADLTVDCMIRVVPMVNPDGIAVSQKGIGAIRSEELRATITEAYENDFRLVSYQAYGTMENYLRYWKANARGVDLNRNFDIDYWEDMKAGPSYLSSQKYKGELPASEPETAALVELLSALRNPVAVISFHSQGELLYWDCGQTGSLREKNRALAERIAEVNGYELQTTFENPDATFDDWCALEKGIPSVNIETGTGSCPLPIEQFETIWEQNYRLWRVLVTFGA